MNLGLWNLVAALPIGAFGSFGAIMREICESYGPYEITLPFQGNENLSLKWHCNGTNNFPFYILEINTHLGSLGEYTVRFGDFNSKQIGLEIKTPLLDYECISLIFKPNLTHRICAIKTGNLDTRLCGPE